MFSVTEVPTPKGILQFRREELTGFTCRISPERLRRPIDQTLNISLQPGGCPFCRENIFTVTPTFPDGNRIIVGESVTFPNLYPFGKNHVVTVITREHFLETFSRKHLVDALRGQTNALRKTGGYPSINWNFLPSAGASMLHPHMQGLADPCPSQVIGRYLCASSEYRKKHKKVYWDVLCEEERISERYLFGDEIIWSAHAVPLGEREVRGILPVSSLDGFESYIDLLTRGILEILSLYRRLGTHAFNMSLFFDKAGEDHGYRAFCSFISRINPNQMSTSDSAFMERMHLEPVIFTLPEDLGKYYRKEKI